MARMISAGSWTSDLDEFPKAMLVPDGQEIGLEECDGTTGQTHILSRRKKKKKREKKRRERGENEGCY